MILKIILYSGSGRAGGSKSSIFINHSYYNIHKYLSGLQYFSNNVGFNDHQSDCHFCKLVKSTITSTYDIQNILTFPGSGLVLIQIFLIS